MRVFELNRPERLQDCYRRSRVMKEGGIYGKHPAMQRGTMKAPHPLNSEDAIPRLA